MEFKYKIITPPNVELGEISEFLPENFSIKSDGKDIFLTIQYDSEVSREDTYADLQQEIDRILFITQIHLDFSLERIKNDDDSSTEFSTIRSCVNLAANVAGSLRTHGTITQQWEDNNLSVQLGLWRLAKRKGIPLAAQVNLFFQIIEIDHSTKSDREWYPKYDSPNDVPDPRTESKLLRHLMSHGRGTPQEESELVLCHDLISG